MQERRILSNLIQENEIPSSAVVPSAVGTSITNISASKVFNVIYVPIESSDLSLICITVQPKTNGNYTHASSYTSLVTVSDPYPEKTLDYPHNYTSIAMNSSKIGVYIISPGEVHYYYKVPNNASGGASYINLHLVPCVNTTSSSTSINPYSSSLEFSGYVKIKFSLPLCATTYTLSSGYHDVYVDNE